VALVKLCRCGRRHWSRCPHGWYLDTRVAGRRSSARPRGTPRGRRARGTCRSPPPRRRRAPSARGVAGPAQGFRQGL